MADIIYIVGHKNPDTDSKIEKSRTVFRAHNIFMVVLLKQSYTEFKGY